MFLLVEEPVMICKNKYDGSGYPTVSSTIPAATNPITINKSVFPTSISAADIASGDQTVTYTVTISNSAPVPIVID